MAATFFILLILIAVFVGYLMSIALLVEAAKGKGHTEGAGMLWAIGLLASPIVLGLCVCALPDKHLRELVAANGDSTAPSTTEQDELPSI